ncbi:DUF295 family protein [Medicago truncatula]|uniref:DUF295 family protein n=1 Tax=Medicago truncatula TaxID=3880 RepID=G7K1R2_MEDTR|nr:DUF295 family protein [Medicago truncatula]
MLVAESLVGGGDVKFLVESKGDLLLVDVYDCTRIGFPGHNPVRIHLFKLNEKETEWVKLKSLGDIVLFLGADCSFSASASDLSVAKGCILDLDKHQPSPLSDYPEYFNLFPQPPEWIVKSCIRN